MMTFEEWEVKYFFEMYDYRPVINDYFSTKYREKYRPSKYAWIASAGSTLGYQLSTVERINAIDSFHAWIYNKKELCEDYTIKEAWENGHIWGVMKRDEL